MKKILQKVLQYSEGYLDRLVGTDKPTLYYNTRGIFKDILIHLPQLSEKYRPTPWLCNAHVHILYFDLIKKNTIKLKYDVIEQLEMSDGGG